MKNLILIVLVSLVLKSYFKINAQSVEEKIISLRAKLTEFSLDAYIIPSEDEHQSEYVSNYDKRRAWISGFTGSSGVAVVTKTKAALWTDSRYYLEAEQEIDKNIWTLMKASESSTPKIEEWLQNDPTIKKVGQNSKFTSIKDWQARETTLNKSNIKLESPSEDLIDLIWTENRPNKPNSNLIIHELKYAGKLFTDKLVDVQSKINNADANVFVVTALDEIAWLFNLRGSDIPYNPMFFAYAIINANQSEPHKLFINQSRDNFKDIKTNHLNKTNLEIEEYNSIIDGIKFYTQRGDTVWISPESSYYIFNAVEDKNKLINQASPVRSLKAVKNDVELKVTRECQVRDSIARIKHMYWLETEIKKGSKITEKSAAEKLKQIQSEDSLFKELSFSTISAVGANAAKVHYSTEDGTNEQLTKDKVYLLDAGAQYYDCTTDITRTHHYGKPSEFEKLTYTKVLQGSINLANAVFPPGVYGRSVDIEARAPLWNIGLDYGHGTGHGIGHFLSVHENPPTTSYNSRSIYDEPYAPGMITSDEPGYYEDGQFGIRLETDLEVIKADTNHHFRDRIYLKFNALTLVPFERSLIDTCVLTDTQVNWLNEYYDKIDSSLGPKLNKTELDYLKLKTERFVYSYKNEECKNYTGKSNSINSFKNIYLILIVTCVNLYVLIF